MPAPHADGQAGTGRGRCALRRQGGDLSENAYRRCRLPLFECASNGGTSAHLMMLGVQARSTNLGGGIAEQGWRFFGRPLGTTPAGVAAARPEDRESPVAGCAFTLMDQRGSGP